MRRDRPHSSVPGTPALPESTHGVERTAVIDLGSNSFRLVVFSANEGWWKRTDEIYEAVRIGAGLAESGELSEERMTAQFLPGDGPASKKQLKALRAHVLEELESAPWLERAGDRLVGIGGTVRNLAAAAAAAADLPSIGIQGHVISRDDLAGLISE